MYPPPLFTKGLTRLKWPLATWTSSGHLFMAQVSAVHGAVLELIVFLPIVATFVRQFSRIDLQTGMNLRRELTWTSCGSWAPGAWGCGRQWTSSSRGSCTTSTWRLASPPSCWARSPTRPSTSTPTWTAPLSGWPSPKVSSQGQRQARPLGTHWSSCCPTLP